MIQKIFRLISFIRPAAVYMLAAWVVAIIILSSTPGIPALRLHTKGSDIRLDYLIHFVEYGILAFLTLLSSEKKDFRFNYKKYLIVISALAVFAFADEFHQKFIPGRTFNPRDLLSNLSGIIAAVILYIYIIKTCSRDRQFNKP